jgi:DNA-binding XRE family transcriptional regulator
MAQEGKTLGQLVADLQAEYGEHQYGRIDLHIPDDIKNAAIARARALKPGDPVFAGMPILRQENLDGVKFYLDNPEAKTKPNAAETWLLLRASGTEPLMRIYTESCSRKSPSSSKRTRIRNIKPQLPGESGLYNRIAVLRAERGISRQELADALGVNYQTIGFLERGDYGPSLKLAFQIAEYFDLPVEAIFSSQPLKPLSQQVYANSQSPEKE